MSGNIKEFSIVTDPGLIIYIQITQWNGLQLNADDGFFAVSPLNPYLYMPEVSSGVYVVDENRAPWVNGFFTSIISKQVGSAPDQLADVILRVNEFGMMNDLIGTNFFSLTIPTLVNEGVLVTDPLGDTTVVSQPDMGLFELTMTDGVVAWTPPASGAPVGPQIYNNAFFVNTNININDNFYGTYSPGERVFVNGQSQPQYNGIYVCTDQGSNVYTLIRSPDMASGSKVYFGSMCTDAPTGNVYQLAAGGFQIYDYYTIDTDGFQFSILPGGDDPRIFITNQGFFGCGILIGNDRDSVRTFSVYPTGMTYSWAYLCYTNVNYDVTVDSEKVLKLYNNSGSLESKWDFPITNMTPASSSDTGNKGQTAWDDNYFYQCIDTNTWVRSPLATW